MRGVVVDIKDDRAVILADNGDFLNVNNKEYKIGQKVSATRGSVIAFLKVAACIALCLIVSTVSYKFYYTPYNYIYIDINPSVRLDINYFDVVIDCVPLNADAEFIEISSGNIEESVSEVISECEEKGFLNEKNNEIEINVSDNKICTKVASIEKKNSDKNYNLTVKQTTTGEIQVANKYRISVKRHRAINDFTEKYGGDCEENIEKLQGKTTREIDIIVSEEQNGKEEPYTKYLENETNKDSITTVDSSAAKTESSKVKTEPKQPKYNKQNNKNYAEKQKNDQVKTENTNPASNDKPFDVDDKEPVGSDNPNNHHNGPFRDDKKDDGTGIPPEMTSDLECDEGGPLEKGPNSNHRDEKPNEENFRHPEEERPDVNAPTAANPTDPQQSGKEPSLNHRDEKPNEEKFKYPEEERPTANEPPAEKPTDPQPSGKEQGKETQTIPDAPKSHPEFDAPPRGEMPQTSADHRGEGRR